MRMEMKTTTTQATRYVTGSRPEKPRSAAMTRKEGWIVTGIPNKRNAGISPMMAYVGRLGTMPGVTLAPMHDDLRANVSADLPRLVELLGDLVRLPTVSAAGHDQSKVRE